MSELRAGPRARVFLVDDHPLVRESLARLINQQSDMEVCGEAEEVGQALRDIAASGPDAAIVDISLHGSSGLELIKTLKRTTPGCATIVLSMHDERIYAERAIRAGARGYVMKRESTKHIVNAIREVLQGRLCVSEEMAGALAERLDGDRKPISASPVEALSDRELEVFTLIGAGRETRQIAGELNVSMKTVQAYCARIKEKLQIESATELLREAVRWQERNAKNP